VRIEAYRAQKAAAAAAHVAAPKPTTALMLNEVQVTGIFRTPRGWSAMVEATPLSPKLSYVIYPGENFFDGQLVAIEEGRLVFRRDVLWSDGKREKMVEIKPLRVFNPVEAMVAAKQPTAEQPAEAKSEAKPETAKPNPEKQ
jgi:Tfp pilus assembly protein PilP